MKLFNISGVEIRAKTDEIARQLWRELMKPEIDRFQKYMEDHSREDVHIQIGFIKLNGDDPRGVGGS